MPWRTIDKKSPVPMVRQLYGQVRQAILAGRLAPGSRLPASRELAKTLGISRNVVLEAYDLLYAEGFLTARQGAGTFVAEGTALPGGHARNRPPEPLAAARVTMGYDCPPGIINFRAGTPNLGLFPIKLWLKMQREALLLPSAEMLAYGHPEGRRELREAICRYVVSHREVSCHPDQIVITGGTTQAIGIACQLLLAGRRDVVLEDPITRDIQLIVAGHGGIIRPVPVDNDGMQTEKLPGSLAPAFVYVTPSHQFPIGGTLPIQRRIDLLNYTDRTGAYLIEDDYDSEFRFDGPPLSSLHGLYPERVVYIGTFSKTLCPAIRIGYLVLPTALIGPGRSRKWLSDLHNEVTSQLTLASFIDRGCYLRHVGLMRKHYRERRLDLIRALTHNFADQVEVLGSAAGLHLVARFPGRVFTDSFFTATATAGARFYPVESHAIRPGRHADKLLIGYGNLDRQAIGAGIAILAEVLGRQPESPG